MSCLGTESLNTKQEQILALLESYNTAQGEKSKRKIVRKLSKSLSKPIVEREAAEAKFGLIGSNIGKIGGSLAVACFSCVMDASAEADANFVRIVLEGIVGGTSPTTKSELLQLLRNSTNSNLTGLITYLTKLIDPLLGALEEDVSASVPVAPPMFMGAVEPELDLTVPEPPAVQAVEQIQEKELERSPLRPRQPSSAYAPAPVSALKPEPGFGSPMSQLEKIVATKRTLKSVARLQREARPAITGDTFTAPEAQVTDKDTAPLEQKKSPSRMSFAERARIASGGLTNAMRVRREGVLSPVKMRSDSAAPKPSLPQVNNENAVPMQENMPTPTADTKVLGKRRSPERPASFDFTSPTKRMRV